MRGGARLFARLSASSDPRQRDARRDAAVADQSCLLSGTDGRHARGDRGGTLCGVPRRDARGLGAGRYSAGRNMIVSSARNAAPGTTSRYPLDASSPKARMLQITTAMCADSREKTAMAVSLKVNGA